jgi:hypothetical protein
MGLILIVIEDICGRNWPRGDFGSILLMWDRMIVEKSFGGGGGESLIFYAPLQTLKMVQGFMGLIPIVIEDIYGRNWLAGLVCGTCHGKLEETLTSPVFLVKDWVKLVFVQL